MLKFSDFLLESSSAAVLDTSQWSHGASKIVRCAGGVELALTASHGVHEGAVTEEESWLMCELDGFYRDGRKVDLSERYVLLKDGSYSSGDQLVLAPLELRVVRHTKAFSMSVFTERTEDFPYMSVPSIGTLREVEAEEAPQLEDGLYVMELVDDEGRALMVIEVSGGSHAMLLSNSVTNTEASARAVAAAPIPDVGEEFVIGSLEVGELASMWRITPKTAPTALKMLLLDFSSKIPACSKVSGTPELLKNTAIRAKSESKYENLKIWQTLHAVAKVGGDRSAVVWNKWCDASSESDASESVVDDIKRRFSSDPSVRQFKDELKKIWYGEKGAEELKKKEAPADDVRVQEPDPHGINLSVNPSMSHRNFVYVYSNGEWVVLKPAFKSGESSWYYLLGFDDAVLSKALGEMRHGWMVRTVSGVVAPMREAVLEFYRMKHIIYTLDLESAT